MKFEHFSIKVNQDQAYKLYQLSQLALLDSYSFETEVEEITGYISPKNKWKLEEFYDWLYGFSFKIWWFYKFR